MLHIVRRLPRRVQAVLVFVSALALATGALIIGR